MAEESTSPPPPPEVSHSSFTYMLIGAAIGSVASVILVAFMNRQAMLQRKRQRGNHAGGPPSSGSPLNILDDEKVA